VVPRHLLKHLLFEARADVLGSVFINSRTVYVSVGDVAILITDGRKEIPSERVRDR
jgi:hypothetical protein